MRGVDVVRLLARLGIETRRQGSELWARCPAHADRTPSWSINVETGAHNCFSCGWGGGVPTLVIRALGADSLAWTPDDVWSWLGAQGLLEDSPPELSVEMVLASGRPSRGLDLPREVRSGPLDEWPTPARRYVVRRGIASWQVTRWRLGYAVDGRLAGRLILPVRDGRGRLRTYSARTYLDDPVRYLMPRRAEGADASTLFGEEHWPSLDSRERVVVTEGALDALAVERALWSRVRRLQPVAGMLGATRAAALLVAAKLATFGEVVVLTDSDEAGETAWCVLRDALVRHCAVRRARLPAGTDASEAGDALLLEVL